MKQILSNDYQNPTCLQLFKTHLIDTSPAPALKSPNAAYTDSELQLQTLQHPHHISPLSTSSTDPSQHIDPNGRIHFSVYQQLLRRLTKETELDMSIIQTITY